MSPRRIDPEIDYKKLRELANEFTSRWNQLQALYLDAVAGFTLLREDVEGDQTRSRSIMQGTELDSEQFQDTLSFSYKRIFSDGFCTSSIHRAKQGEVKSRNSPGGANFTALGQVCLVSFSTFWNDYLRREYVVAKGKLDPNEKDEAVVKKTLREHASHDLWGDIGKLRNSIVHNQGFVSSKVKKFELIKWFKPGDKIVLTPDHMRTLFLALLRYRNELFKEQSPEHYIQITSK